MNSEIDTKFNIIIECANRILEFEKDLAAAETDFEKEHLTFFIEEQKKLIKEYTDISPEDIIPYVAGINALKNIIENEKDSEKKAEEKTRLVTLTSSLKSEICKTDSKENKFRHSQKLDIVPSITLKEESHVPDLANKQR